MRAKIKSENSHYIQPKGYKTDGSEGFVYGGLHESMYHFTYLISTDSTGHGRQVLSIVEAETVNY